MDIGKNRNRILVVAGLTIATLLLLWLAFRPAAVKVELAQVGRISLLDTVDAEGRTRVKRKFTVTAPVSGKLKRIELKEGDNILRNYPITEIDPNPPIPRSPSEPYPSFNPYAARVFAPASGTILEIFEKSERFIEVGTPLLEIGDVSNLEIVIDVLSSEASRVRPGSRILIEDAETGTTMRGQVKTVEPQATTKVSALGVEEKRVDIVADFIDAKPRLGDNFRLDVHIVLWQGENVLCVPNSSLFRSGEDWNVFVVEYGRAFARKIETGHRSHTETQVLSGVSEGDMVIVHPPNILSDGSRVSED